MTASAPRAVQPARVQGRSGFGAQRKLLSVFGSFRFCPEAVIQHGGKGCRVGVATGPSPRRFRTTSGRPERATPPGRFLLFVDAGPQSLLLRRQANAARADQTGIRRFEPPESARRRAFEKDVAVLWPT